MAVCNRPIDRDALIAALGESLPGTRLKTVRVSADSTDLLDDVMDQAGPNPQGPVMLVDLEKAVPSAVKNHLVLEALNLRRPEWPVLVRHPVVFWVPDYMLGLFGRTAPDFFDWRSDTFFFPAFTEAQLRPLQEEPWDGGLDRRLSEPDRRARIHELRSRLASSSHGDTPFVQTTRADWLSEMGNHLCFLGEYAEAEQCYTQVLDINELLGRREVLAAQYGNLGLIYRARGDLDRAESMHYQALEINKSFGHRKWMAANYGNLALIYRARGDLDRAESVQRRALEINESLGHREGMARDYGNLAVLYGARGDLDRAEAMLHQALEINQPLGHREGMAANCGNLGLIYRARGDLDRAEAMHREALELDESLGCRGGMADQYGNLGLIYRARGDLDRAEAMLRQALEIDELLGRREGMARVYGNLGLIHRERGESTQAEAAWLTARELFRAIGMPQDVRQVQGLLDTLLAAPKCKESAAKRRHRKRH